MFGSSAKDHGIFDNQILLYSAACQNPTFAYGYDGKNEAANSINPPRLLLQEKNDTKDMNFNTHLRLTYSLSPYLKVSLFGSYLYASTENGQFCPTSVWAQGNVYRSETKREEVLGNMAVNYSRSWGIHSVNANASAEYHKQTQTAFWTASKGITTNAFGYDNIGAAASRPYGGTGSTYEDQSLASVMGNASYTLLDRYTVSATVRGDGSSMVGDNHTWGFFPSLSLTWDVLKEVWARHLRPVSMLKLRAGWGKSGNLGGISAYTTMNSARQTGIVPVNGTPTVTLGTVRNNNPDLTWETKSTFNIGVECGLDRLNASSCTHKGKLRAAVTAASCLRFGTHEQNVCVTEQHDVVV